MQRRQDRGDAARPPRIESIIRAGARDFAAERALLSRAERLYMTRGGCICGDYCLNGSAMQGLMLGYAGVSGIVEMSKILLFT